MYWNKLDTGDTEYEIDIQASSSLPDSKGGKLSFVMDMAQLGIITDPAMMLELLEFPGQEQVFESILGDQHLAKEYIARLVDESAAYVAPEEVENHQIIIQKIVAYFKSKRFSNMSEKVKNKFRRHISERLQLIKAATPPPPAPALQTAAIPPSPVGGM